MNERDREREVAQLEAELPELKAKLRQGQREADGREVSLREELEPQMREVLGFARKRGHTWIDIQPPFSGPPEDYGDDQLVEWLVEAFSGKEVDRLRRDAVSIEREIREKRSELKKKRQHLANLREMFGHPPD